MLFRVFVMLFAVTGAACVHAAPKPNVLLIVIDDLGYGDLGCYGNTIHDTSNIDTLAAGGMKLTDFHTNGPVCSPTRAALMTGRYQQRTGIEYALGFNRDQGVPLSEYTIAELLKPAGYVSGVFGKWHIGHVSNFGPNDQGFTDTWCSNNSPDYHTHVSRVGELDWYHNQKLDDEPGYLTDLVTKHTCDFIRDHHDQPFFAFVSHIAVHFPYQGPDDPPLRTLGKIWHKQKLGPLPRSEFPRAYKDMLEVVDRSVGKMINLLDELGLRDNTLVIVTSDNGAYSWVGSNGPFRGQKADLYEGGHRVPAIVNWPGRIKPGTVSDQTTMTMDILPTLLAIADVKVPESVQLDGVDLSGMLFEGQTLAPRQLFWRFNNMYNKTHVRAVRDGDLKYVVEKDGPGLFDLRRDPGEANNLIDARPEDAARLEAAYQRWIKQVTSPNGAASR